MTESQGRYPAGANVPVTPPAWGALPRATPPASLASIALSVPLQVGPQVPEV
jgi:hypothetical protein